MTDSHAYTPASDAPKPSMVNKHPCPECGANLEWNAKAQSLKCPYCGTVVPWNDKVREELGQGI
ncbi:MAG: zinc ribbon domain-containing protein, partial [Comamonas sp.]